MKKVLKYTGIIAAVLAIVSFILVMAGNGIKSDLTGALTVHGTTVIFGGTESLKLVSATYKGAPTALIAWILTLAAILILVLGALLPVLKVKVLDKFAGILNVVAVLALVVAGVLTFFGKASFLAANSLEDLAEHYALTANVILGGIFAIVAGVVAILPAAADFLSKKK